jgi:hypothetical protein
MITLMYNGLLLDTRLETEMVSETKFGLNAEVEYYDGAKEIRYNMHEVHHLYQSFEPRIAFESNYHSDGGSRAIYEVKSVVITDAKEFSQESLVYISNK